MSTNNAAPELHFVTEYARHVQMLLDAHPLDEAMSLAVGGAYDHIGQQEVAILQKHGLGPAHSLIDLGCGSGRLAKHLGLTYPDVRFLGTDVVQSLLDYAATQSPSHFRFLLHREISIPAPDASVDFISAFSVFTHLFHEESYIYLDDMKRVLRPGGKIVFTFIESQTNWPIFEIMVAGARAGQNTVLNMFMERTQITAWAIKLGLLIEALYADPDLGQSVAVLRKV